MKVVEKGVLPCADCKQPHDCYAEGAFVSWRSRSRDKHVYRPIGDRNVLIELVRRGAISAGQILEVAG